MRDRDIRGALVQHLQQCHGSEPDTLIRHEVGICAGRRRVDVAVVNGEIAGYEIKSDEDTLARLEGQAAAYGQVLDRATIVTTVRHVDRAVAGLPGWWGVMVARPEREGVVVARVRKGRRNSNLDPYALAQLLWRDEALAELVDRGLARGLSAKARHYIWVALIEAVPLTELRSVVRARLKARQAWPGGQ